MTMKEQEKFYKSVLTVLEDEAATRSLDDKQDRAETAAILTRRLGSGDLDFYRRTLQILEDSCATYSLDDELDRVRTARAIAKDW
jgi:hypothetical protein